MCKREIDGTWNSQIHRLPGVCWTLEKTITVGISCIHCINRASPYTGVSINLQRSQTITIYFLSPAIISFQIPDQFSNMVSGINNYYFTYWNICMELWTYPFCKITFLEMNHTITSVLNMYTLCVQHGCIRVTGMIGIAKPNVWGRRKRSPIQSARGQWDRSTGDKPERIVPPRRSILSWALR